MGNEFRYIEKFYLLCCLCDCTLSHKLCIYVLYFVFLWLWFQFIVYSCDTSTYPKTSDISYTLFGNKIVYQSYVDGTMLVGAAPTTSSFLTEHLASTDCVKTTARWDDKHLSIGIWYAMLLEVLWYIWSLGLPHCHRGNHMITLMPVNKHGILW